MCRWEPGGVSYWEAHILSQFSLLPTPQLMIFNVGATVLYITAFITCSAAVEQTSLKGTRPYNQRAAASVSMVPWQCQWACQS